MLAPVTDAHFVPERSPGVRSPDRIVLTGADLDITDVEAVARRGASASLDLHARDRMQEARDVIEALVARGDVVYGVTTGFGDLATTSIPPADAARLQENLLVSHAAGVGSAFPREVVRAMLLLRANTLALGHSGCRPLLVDRICRFLEAGIHPVVPEQGSVERLGGSRTARASCAAPDRARAGGAPRPGGARDGGPPGVRPGAPGPGGQGGPCAPQRHPADERARRAAPRRRRPAGADSLRGRGDVGRGAPGDGCCLCGAVPARAATPGPGRGGGGSGTCCAAPGCRPRTMGLPTRSRTPTRCAVSPRCTARCATRSTISGGCWTSAELRDGQSARVPGGWGGAH